MERRHGVFLPDEVLRRLTGAPVCETMLLLV